MYSAQHLEALWWRFFWPLRRQYMLVEDMAAVTADTLADMLSRMLRADTLALVFAVGVAIVSSAMRAETHALQGAHFMRLAAAGDAAVAGEVVIGIRTMDIPGLAITVWATAIRITVITVIHVTDIIPGDTILTATDTGLTGAQASGSLSTELSHH
jgi:hypothetical protein